MYATAETPSDITRRHSNTAQAREIAKLPGRTIGRPDLWRRILAIVAYPGIVTFGVLGFTFLRLQELPPAVAAYTPVMVGATLVTLLESVLPYRPAWRPGRLDVLNDLAFMAAVQVLLPMLLSLLVVVTAAETVAAGGWIPDGIWPHRLPIIIQVVLMMAIADFSRYWLHRACHSVGFLWRLHAVHHSPRQLYWLNAGRFHPIEKSIQYMVDSLPFILLGVSADVLALYFVLYAINGFFQHSNCAVRLGPLNYLISGPELHRWHHSKIIAESNANYGNNLIVWDLLFGTRFLPRDRQVGELGLIDRHYPHGFVAQVAAPFASQGK